MSYNGNKLLIISKKIPDKLQNCVIPPQNMYTGLDRIEVSTHNYGSNCGKYPSYHAIIIDLSTGMFKYEENNLTVGNGQLDHINRKLSDDLYEVLWEVPTTAIKDPIYLFYISDGIYDKLIKLNSLPQYINDAANTLINVGETKIDNYIIQNYETLLYVS